MVIIIETTPQYKYLGNIISTTQTSRGDVLVKIVIIYAVKLEKPFPAWNTV